MAASHPAGRRVYVIGSPGGACAVDWRGAHCMHSSRSRFSYRQDTTTTLRLFLSRARCIDTGAAAWRGSLVLQTGAPPSHRDALWPALAAPTYVHTTHASDARPFAVPGPADSPALLYTYVPQHHGRSTPSIRASQHVIMSTTSPRMDEPALSGAACRVQFLHAGSDRRAVPPMSPCSHNAESHVASSSLGAEETDLGTNTLPPHYSRLPSNMYHRPPRLKTTCVSCLLATSTPPKSLLVHDTPAPSSCNRPPLSQQIPCSPL